MGTIGEFKEYVNTGSAGANQAKYPYNYIYDPVPSVTSRPNVTAIHIADTTERAGSWSYVLALSATKFAMLSGSILNMSGSSVPAGTELVGGFYKIQLVSGDVIVK